MDGDTFKTIKDMATERKRHQSRLSHRLNAFDNNRDRQFYF